MQIRYIVSFLAKMINVAAYVFMKRKILKLNEMRLYEGFYKKQIEQHLDKPPKFDDHYGKARDYIVNILESMQPGSNILELGCYLGKRLNWYAEKYQSFKFTGVDISHETLRLARHSIVGTTNLNLVIGDFHSMPFKEGSFDLIFSLASVYHVPYHEIEGIFSNIQRLSRGKVLLIEPFHKVQPFRDKVNLIGSRDKYSHDYQSLGKNSRLRLLEAVPIRSMERADSYPLTIFHFEKY